MPREATQEVQASLDKIPGEDQWRGITDPERSKAGDIPEEVIELIDQGDTIAHMLRLILGGGTPSKDAIHRALDEWNEVVTVFEDDES